ncbi:hypothetical protein VOLCADRAFT_102603 [Volvox carteri f. nagariensis]|uniref:Glutathione S-transferase n=1 Tax=Volvox carteri f. nagariensis TaxID=3068 RepID=D8TGZ4_VOLCA|nr:uncharacterized protein VOLCADRAFT_102603 [Volvox carteri f. nagariensis]EFJ52621.1 hypothetical protein VOLCADRAFT_102603 [Volvox carteri f. nagariensis]|eukprot:XP_002945626.1 hypothetical protein VOLCADRAFT_102603 [Volvox carteri f. nagariensis]
MLFATSVKSLRVFSNQPAPTLSYLTRPCKVPSPFRPNRVASVTNRKIITEARLSEMPLKLHYFGLPGRAETSRICLTIGKVPYEDVIYEFKTWQEHKAKMPFGQVPVLELEDGKMLAQSGAIERYVAKLAGLYPDDPLQAALADQAAFQMSDILELFTPTFQMSPEEKVKARQEILATKGKEKMLYLSKLLETSGEYVAGDKLSYGDIVIFATLSNLVSGFMDGVPKDLLDEYPVLKAFRNKIASIPAVKEHYEKHGEGYRAAFKPDAA